MIPRDFFAWSSEVDHNHEQGSQPCTYYWRHGYSDRAMIAAIDRLRAVRAILRIVPNAGNS
jgi:hypothetical protein